MIAQFVANGVAAGSHYALLAIAVGLVYRTCGFIDFAQAGFFGLGAYAAFVAMTWFHLPVLASALAALLIVGAASAIYHGVIVLGLRQRNAHGTIMLLASVGTFTVIDGVIVMCFGAEAVSLPSSGIDGGQLVLEARLNSAQIASLTCGFVILCAGGWLQRYTRAGLLWRAVCGDRALAEIVGVAAGQVNWIAFLTACVISGLAGVLQALDTGLSPAMGFGPMLIALVATVLGGKSVLFGAFAAIGLGLLQQTAVIVLPTAWQDAVVFVVLGLILIVKSRRMPQLLERRMIL